MAQLKVTELDFDLIKANIQLLRSLVSYIDKGS